MSYALFQINRSKRIYHFPSSNLTGFYFFCLFKHISPFIHYSDVYVNSFSGFSNNTRLFCISSSPIKRESKHVCKEFCIENIDNSCASVVLIFVLYVIRYQKPFRTFYHTVSFKSYVRLFLFIGSKKRNNLSNTRKHLRF